MNQKLNSKGKPYSKKHLKQERAKKNPRSTYWRNKADALWSELIRRPGVCAVCGEGNVQAHHLISRSAAATRHRLENGIALCPKHHRLDARLSAHKGPMAFAAWINQHHPDRWVWVNEHKWDVVRPNYKEAYEYLCDVRRAL
jgi:hypothetical protein